MITGVLPQTIDARTIRRTGELDVDFTPFIDETNGACDLEVGADYTDELNTQMRVALAVGCDESHIPRTAIETYDGTVYIVAETEEVINERIETALAAAEIARITAQTNAGMDALVNLLEPKTAP